MEMEFKLFNEHSFFDGIKVTNNEILNKEKAMLATFKENPGAVFQSWQAGKVAIVALKASYVEGMNVLRVFICNNGYTIKEYEVTGNEQAPVPDAADTVPKQALLDAIKLIKGWHNMRTSSPLHESLQEDMWRIYNEKSPEMKRLNQYLSAPLSNKKQEREQYYYVKVFRCSDPGFWYADFRGSRFIVKRIDNPFDDRQKHPEEYVLQIVSEGDHNGDYIEVRDAEILSLNI